MLSAQDFFLRHAEGGELSRELQRVDPAVQLAWECDSVSPYSPGAVAGAEILARQVLDPAFYDDQAGEPKPSLFDDASTRGASVNRLTHISEERLHQLGKGRACQASLRAAVRKTYIGFVTVQAGDARALTVDGDGGGRHRAFGIYDTAVAAEISHADICQLVSGKQRGRSVRSRLFQLSKGTLHRTNSA